MIAGGSLPGDPARLWLPAILGSALLLVPAQPGHDLGFLAWFALVPFLVALRGRGPMAAGSLGLLFGMVFTMASCSWFLEAEGFGLLELLLVGLFFGLSYALFGTALGVVSRRSPRLSLVAAPFLWVAMEYLRVNAGFLSVPGPLLAHTQYRNLPVIQIAALTGAYGVSFLLLCVNALLAEICGTLRVRRAASVPRKSAPLPLRETAAVAGLLLLSLGYGIAALGQGGEGRRITVSVIQGNIPQKIRWSPELRERHLEKHLRLSREAAAASRTELIVWPETTVQGSVHKDPRLNAALRGLAREARAALLIGSAERPKFRADDRGSPNRFNSAFLVTRDGVIAGEYRKLKLFPFGEYLPFQGVLPWPAGYLKTSNYLPGEDLALLDIGTARFGALICWEASFPELARELARRGADFIVNITNEAWFGDSPGQRFFLAGSVYRAVEQRSSVIRAANSGISCFIDPWGRILGRVAREGRDVNVEGSLTRSVPLSSGGSLYTRAGDIFAFACVGIGAIMLLASQVRRCRPKG